MTSISVKRAVKLYREKGIAGFFQEPNRRGPAVLTAAFLEKAQELLDAGLETSEVAAALDVKRDILAKAIRAGYGEQTQLPRHYVARQKLCLRATTDYWVNAMDGQPFFFVLCSLSTKPSIPDCSRCWNTRSCPVWKRRSPTSRPPRNWRPIPSCIASP